MQKCNWMFATAIPHQINSIYRYVIGIGCHFINKTIEQGLVYVCQDKYNARAIERHLWILKQTKSLATLATDSVARVAP